MACIFASQSEFGDYDVEEHRSGVEYLKESVPFAPDQKDELLDKIVEIHKTHRGQSPAEAESNYLDNAKLLAMYGVHLHKAKDSEGVDLMVGVCASGLMVYQEKLRIHRFAWPKILKIAYKRNNFYIKVRPGEFEQPHSTMAFKCENYTMAKRLWKIAVEHHAFFRLKEPEPAHRAKFPHFGSKFRYSGRTQFQTRGDGSKTREKTPTIDRAASRRYKGSTPYANANSGPSISTERAEQMIISGDNYAPTTLDLKNRKKPGQVPFAAIEDDRNLSGMDPHDQDASVNLTGYSTASYSKGGQYNGGGYYPQGSTPMFDKYGNPILGGREGPYNGDADNSSYGGTAEKRRTGPPTLEKPGFRQSRIDRDSKGNLMRKPGSQGDEDDLPPYQEDQHLLHGVGAAGGDKYNPYSVTTTTRTTTRTYTGTDGTLITEHKVEKDGVIETRIEKKTTVVAADDENDYDKALADAILGVTQVNPDLSVEKIEIRTEQEKK
jgi:hypothetical protein